jgi:photosystem II stability/assembly factor-like uncharacterized protein
MKAAIVILTIIVAISSATLPVRAQLESKPAIKKLNKEKSELEKRAEWELRNKIVSGMINKSRSQKHLPISAFKQSLPQSQSQSGWAPIGPVTVAKAYDTTNSVGMGRVNCIAFHPTNKDIFWIGASSGGIWKTENGGKTCIPIGDDLPEMQISSIAVDPANTDIMYAAPGDWDQGSFTEQGIIKSTDGGSSWAQTSLASDPNFQYSSLRSILINPQNTSEIVVAGYDGIWKSVDYGTSWVFTKILENTDLVNSEADPKTLYVASKKLGVRKSTDFGTTWKTANPNVPLTEVARMSLAVSPTDPNYVYLIATNGKTSGFHSFYSSTNGGESWTRTMLYKTGTNLMGWLDGDSTDTYNGTSGQGTYDLALVVDPDDKNKVYASGINMWESDDAGKTWDLVTFWSNCFGKTLHCDIHATAFNLLDKKLYVCSDGGLYRAAGVKPGSKEWMKWIDRKTFDPIVGHPIFEFPTKWEDICGGLSITEFYSIALSRDNPGYVAAGAQDNSCFYFDKNNWLNYIANWDGMSVMIDHSDPKIIYGVWQNGGFNRSDDGGITVIQRLADTLTDPDTGIDQAGEWVTPIGMDATDSKTVYIGLANVWRSHSRGTNWEKILDFQALAPNSANTNLVDLIKNSYSDSKYMAVTRYGYSWVGMPSELWITKDGATTWTNVTQGLPLDSAAVTAIEYDRTDPNKMWLLCNDLNIYVSSNGGLTWQVTNKPFTDYGVTSIVHYQNSPRNTLFIGTGTGVYFTNDTMTTWLPYSENLPNCRITALAIEESTNKLYASTYGRGVWVTNISSDIQRVASAGGNSFMFDAFPNPSQGNITLNFALSKSDLTAEASIVILDIRGREVWSEKASITGGKLQKSIHTTLENGVYFIELTIGGIQYTKKVSIKK